MVDRRLAVDIDLFSRGGMRVLDKIERQDYDVLSRGPPISKTERVGLLLASLARAGVFAGRRDGRARAILRTTAAAWRAARARNFYYSFVLLPRAAAQRHVRRLRLHALLRRPERRAGRQRARPSNAGARALDEALAGRFGGHPVLAGVPRHRARATASRTEYFHEMIDGVASRPGAAALRDLRRALPLLLPGGLGGGADDHPHLRLRLAGGACRWPRSAASRSSSPTSCATSARTPSAAASTCRSRTCAALGVAEAELLAGGRTQNFLALMRFEAARARVLLPGVGAAGGPGGPAQPLLAARADRAFTGSCSSASKPPISTCFRAGFRSRRSKNRGSWFVLWPPPPGPSVILETCIEFVLAFKAFFQILFKRRTVRCGGRGPGPFARRRPPAPRRPPRPPRPGAHRGRRPPDALHPAARFAPDRFRHGGHLALRRRPGGRGRARRCTTSAARRSRATSRCSR